MLKSSHSNTLEGGNTEELSVRILSSPDRIPHRILSHEHLLSPKEHWAATVKKSVLRQNRVIKVFRAPLEEKASSTSSIEKESQNTEVKSSPVKGVTKLTSVTKALIKRRLQLDNYIQRSKSALECPNFSNKSEKEIPIHETHSLAICKNMNIDRNHLFPNKNLMPISPSKAKLNVPASRQRKISAPSMLTSNNSMTNESQGHITFVDEDGKKVYERSKTFESCLQNESSATTYFHLPSITVDTNGKDDKSKNDSSKVKHSQECIKLPPITPETKNIEPSPKCPKSTSVLWERRGNGIRAKECFHEQGVLQKLLQEKQRVRDINEIYREHILRNNEHKWI